MSFAPFSLLIPVYHGDTAEGFERAVLSSTAEQHLQPQEVVIVQDGPVSAAIRAAIERVRHRVPGRVEVVELAENRGLATALNEGLTRCSHDIVARIDADDVSLPRRFSRQWILMEQGFDLVGTGMVEFRGDPAQTGRERIPPHGAQRIRQHARTHNPVNHPTMMYRKQTILDVGGYEPFGSMEDYWLVVRLLQADARVENIPDPLVAYNVSGAFARRGGVAVAKTELELQRRLREMQFITTAEYVRNVVMKGVYRLIPAPVKRVLFHRFIARGLPSDRS